MRLFISVILTVGILSSCSKEKYTEKHLEDTWFVYKDERILISTDSGVIGQEETIFKDGSYLTFDNATVYTYWADINVRDTFSYELLSHDELAITGTGIADQIVDTFSIVSISRKELSISQVTDFPFDTLNNDPYVEATYFLKTEAPD